MRTTTPTRCSLVLVVLLANWPADAGEPRLIAHPRQTSGDRAAQPIWTERLTVTVGPRDADIVGHDHRAIQAAVDHVARLGGGTVRIRPGEYHLRNAIYLQSGVDLIGDGAGTVLIKEPSSTSPLAEDSDWYDQEITMQDAAGFRVGDGVCLRAKDPKTGAHTVLKRTLVARTGNRFKLDKPLRENFWQMHGAIVSTLFPILSGDGIEEVRLENLVLDGDREHNAELDGNYAGCIFLQDCNRIQIRGVTARNYHGDGISWQIVCPAQQAGHSSEASPGSPGAARGGLREIYRTTPGLGAGRQDRAQLVSVVSRAASSRRDISCAGARPLPDCR